MRALNVNNRRSNQWRARRPRCDAERIAVVPGRRCLLFDAVTLLVLAHVGCDQLRQEADRHHLSAEQQRHGRVDERRPLVQWLKGEAEVATLQNPCEGEPEHPQHTQREAEQTDAAQEMLRALSETGEEFHREQIEEAFNETPHAVLGVAELAGAMVDAELADLEAARRGQNGGSSAGLSPRWAASADCIGRSKRICQRARRLCVRWESRCWWRESFQNSAGPEVVEFVALRQTNRRAKGNER